MPHLLIVPDHDELNQAKLFLSLHVGVAGARSQAGLALPLDLGRRLLHVLARSGVDLHRLLALLREIHKT